MFSPEQTFNDRDEWRLLAEELSLIPGMADTGRLGHDAMDVRKTVEQLAASGIRVHFLALGGVDLPARPAR